MARTQITSAQLSSSVIIGREGTDHNPLPTSFADSPSTSLTFTLPVACNLYIDFGCRMQINTNLTSDCVLNVDGSDVSGVQFQNPVAGQTYNNVSKVKKVSLAAGSHTIKLRGKATQSNAAVNIEPYWWATVVSQ